MGVARLYRCPACGGEVEEAARRCTFCSAPLATLRCANCFHMNVPEAVHCSGCGRELGLEPLGEPDAAQCPRCKASLQAFRTGPGVLLDCDRCGGQFVENALLRELLERKQVVRQGLPPEAPTPPTPEREVRYLACPVCANLMQRKNFGRSSGVIVDVCPRHGIWFDAGELPRVLAFVESGGLERAEARHREAERLSRRAGAANGNDLPPLSLVSGKTAGSSLDLATLDDLGDAARALIDYLRRLLP